VISGLRTAVKRHSPFILFAASGGARMQEGILSLMQMPRTTVAVQELREAKLPYVVVLTHPTTGGVTASYAMLGDIHIAEPGALIGFAGPRVIEQTIREQLPNGFQRAEYLLDHGMVDMVVHRHQLRDTLGRICRLLTHTRPGRDIAIPEHLDGMNSHPAPATTLARLGGNGEIVDIEIEEDDDDHMNEPFGTPAEPRPPRNV
jgi:acetyl-CoA carboxylase carboxyl transferase subunit beta